MIILKIVFDIFLIIFDNYLSLAIYLKFRPLEVMGDRGLMFDRLPKFTDCWQ